MSKDLYQVERIVGFKIVRGTPHYKVHWLGYSSRQDTWEPVDNLVSCGELIAEYHSHNPAAEENVKKPRRSTRRSMAAARIAGDISSNDDPPARPVRRSQRARTPTRYFLSEMPRRRRRSLTPKKEEKVEKHTTTTEDEEEKEGEESFEVKRSEYELRTNFHTTPRRSPRRQNSVHYFNSELPQHRQHHQPPQQKKGWIAEDDEVSTYQLRSAKTKHSAVPPATALSSDDESQETDVSPRISLYESKMRQRLKNLSNVTKKKVSEALTSLSTQATKPATQSDEERGQASKSIQPNSSQQPKPPSIPSTHVYETRSRSAQSRQTQTSQPTITKMQLRSSKDNKEKEQVTSQPPPIITSSQLSQGPLVPDPQPDGPPQNENPQQPPYPQWMELGWEEVVITFIILGLILFAWYCFSSDDC